MSLNWPASQSVRLVVIEVPNDVPSSDFSNSSIRGGRHMRKGSGIVRHADCLVAHVEPAVAATRRSGCNCCNAAQGAAGDPSHGAPWDGSSGGGGPEPSSGLARGLPVAGDVLLCEVGEVFWP